MRSPSLEVALVDKKEIRTLLRNNAVTVMFVVLCTLCMIFSGQSVSYVIYELFGRLSRNSFIVLALIIPIVAGMGINFAITIGAMAAQIAALWVTEWQIPGIGGFLAVGGTLLVVIGGVGLIVAVLLFCSHGSGMPGGAVLVLLVGKGGKGRDGIIPQLCGKGTNHTNQGYQHKSAPLVFY